MEGSDARIRSGYGLAAPTRSPSVTAPRAGPRGEAVVLCVCALREVLVATAGFASKFWSERTPGEVLEVSVYRYLLVSPRLANVHQKNWVPLVLGESLYLIFTIEPLVVVLVDRATGECTEISEARTPAMHGFYASAGLHDQGHSTMGVHGGSPLIPLPESDAGEFLGIGRIARGNTQYALFFFTVARDVSGPEGTVSFSAPSGFRLARVSPIVCLASTTAHHRGLCETIQFAGGMILADPLAGEGNLAISYGANDCEGKVAVLPLARVLGLLRPAGAAQGRSRARA
ncbi:unnamed protein product [Prorocentrum cordatum]|uniref:Uncharacterized protein n=1 Tax=Prorocentrum cordatum TaxID=2364126 RepID=A0ABN9VAX0_9DINO|nr:unnamed protein product [Polarella glacialis]